MFCGLDIWIACGRDEEAHVDYLSHVTCKCNANPSSVKVRNLGVCSGQMLSMEHQCNHSCKTVHVELRETGKIRRYRFHC